MPQILGGLLNQKCVYWPKGEVGRDGRHAPGDPIELSCNWQNTEKRMLDEGGEFFSTVSTVYLDQEVEKGAWLWEGKLVNAPAEPPANNEIHDCKKRPSVSADETLYVATI